MNILFTSSWFPSKEDETLGNFVERHAIASSLYHHVYVLYVTSAVQNEDFQVDVSEKNGLKTVIVYYKKSNSKLSAPLKFWRFYKGMKLGLQKLEENYNLKKIDVVHHNVHYEAGIIPLYLKRTRNIPYVITEHWTGYLKSNRTKYSGVFRKWLTKRIGAKCDVQLPVSEDLSKALKELNISKGKTRVISNVVEVKEFNLGVKSNINEGAKFIHVSSLDEDQKNISGLLRSFYEHLKSNPSSTLTIVGDGNDKLCKETIQNLNLSASVTLFGRLPLQKIAKLLKEHHIFLLFSNYENLPCVIIESLASGTPVISTDVGGISEHLNSSFGQLIPAKDEMELSNQMSTMINNFDQYNPNELRSYAIKQFSNEIIGKQFSEVYQSLQK